jgi:hypothetical protein
MKAAAERGQLPGAAAKAADQRASGSIDSPRFWSRYRCSNNEF